MAVVRDKLGCKHDVLEFYSPPRVVKMARKLGMTAGVSLDLTVPASHGYVWDFSRKHSTDKAIEIVNEQDTSCMNIPNRPHRGATLASSNLPRREAS